MVDNEIKIIITADIEKASKSLEALGKQLQDTFGKTMNSASQEINIVNKKIENFAKSTKKTFGKMTPEVAAWATEFKDNLSGFNIQSGTDFSGFTGTLTQQLDAAGISMKQFQNYLKDNQMFLTEDGKAVSILTGKVQKLSLVVSEAAKSARRFNFDFLTLIFAGMMLDRIFGSLIRTQLQLFGITDMLSAMWTTVLLPVMDLIVPPLMNIISAIMDLDPAVQGVIGAFVLFAASFGWILSLLGGLKQLGMGWSVFSKVVTGVWGVISKGFMALWGVMSTFVTWVAGALGVSFGAALAIIVGVIALIVAVVLGAIDAWKSNFLGFKDAVKGVWEAIKTYIDGFVTFWKGVWDVIVGIFTLNGDKISSGFTKMGEGIKNMFRGVGNFVINIFNGILSLIIATLAQVVRLAQWVWNKIPGHEKVSWYEDIISAGSGKQLIPSFKTGGIMENTGLAYLHAGEQVIPKNEVGSNSSVNFAPVININASTNASASDISRTVSEELNRQWASKFQRSTTVR